MNPSKKFRAWHLSDIEKGEPIKFEQVEKNGSLYFIANSLRYDFQVPFLESGWILEERVYEEPEIYEGDIIEFKSWLYNYPVKKEVLSKASFLRNLFDFSAEKIRVVGNKWEAKQD